MPALPRLVSLVVVTLLSSCANGTEVYRVTSPDGLFHAVLIESNRRGNVSDFEVNVIPANREDGRPFRLALVRSATRYPDGPGMDLRWSSEPPPAPNVETVLVNVDRTNDFRMSATPGRFRSGTVLICYAVGGPRGGPICANEEPD